MFTLVENPEFWTDVKLRLPGGEEAEFRAQFRLIPPEDYDAAMSMMRAGGKEAVAARNDLLRRIVTGWDGVVDAEGKAVAFDPARLQSLAQHTWFSGPLLNVYLAEITGQGARKN